MTGPQIKDFGQSIVGTAAFISNILFWKESGYFEQAAELKPLLHTWSLAVEEQFYLVYPLAALVLIRMSRVGLYTTFIVTILASLTLSEIGVRTEPAATFYLLPTRVWELLAGALCSAFPLPRDGRKNNILSSVGFLSIVIPILMYDRHTPFPGLSAVPVVIGTTLVLRYAVKGTAANRILSLPPFVGIGLISYSFYLWHQPIFAFARIRAGDQPPTQEMIFLSLLSLAAAWISWRYVERPFRNGTFHFFSTQRGVLTSSGLGLFAVAGLGLVLSETNLQKIRYASVGKLADVTNVYEYFNYNDVVRNGICHSVAEDIFWKNGCLDKRKSNILLWGDSYAAALYPGLEYYRNKSHPEVGITQLTDGNGPPFLRSDRKIDGNVRTLEEVNDFRIKIAEQMQPNAIVMTWFIGGTGGYGRPDADAVALEKVISKIRGVSPETKIIIIGPVPYWRGSLLEQMIGYAITHKAQVSSRYIPGGIRDMESSWEAALQSRSWGQNVTYVSALQAMCRPDGSCLAHVTDDMADLTAIDWGHLTRSGSIYLIGQLTEVLFGPHA